MLQSKLLNWNYYKSKLPLYLQNSYGFEEHFKLMYDVLVNLDTVENAIFREINLFHPNYFSYVDIDGVDPNNYDFVLLDWFASLYNVSRCFSIEYQLVGEEPVEKELKLTNYELLALILTKMVATYYDGTYEDTKNLYDLIGIEVDFFTNISEPGKAYCYLKNANRYTINIQDMFYSGLLIIQSAGIEYSFSVDSLVLELGIWDSTDVNRQWGTGRWS